MALRTSQLKGFDDTPYLFFTTAVKVADCEWDLYEQEMLHDMSHDVTRQYLYS